MEIRELTSADLADDETMGEFYALSRRAELFGREQEPFWSLEEFLGALRSPDQGERQQLFAAYEGGTMVGTAILWSFLLDNTDKAWSQLDVDVTARRRGVGRALAAELEAAVRSDGRTLLLSEAKLPFADRETHGYGRFAAACGYELANYEIVRHLGLPVPEDRLQAWIDEAAPRHEGYTIETFVDGVPAELVPSLCVLLGQLAVDAPTGTVDFDEGAMTPERFVERIERSKAMGRAHFETVALTPDRQVVAQSTLSVPRGEGTEVFQWGTFVHREHRGHRLGLATKAVNLRAVQAFRDDLTRVATQNAETNNYMVSINEHLGFRPVEVSAEFVKRF